jgi:fatty aldehyde decarbonylase
MISPEDPRYPLVYRDVIAHSVTGEAIGIEHYSRMIPLGRSIDERLDLLEDAYHEKLHLLGMREIAEKLDVPVKSDIDGFYWRQIREAFRERADAGDLLGCYVMQDIILETFAVILYDAVLPGSDPFAAERVRMIADEERQHLAHGIEALRAICEQDLEGMRERVEFANQRVARVLAEWTGPDECGPHCGVCNTTCAKLDLNLLGVDMRAVQARFVTDYGRALREIGMPPADVTRWLARLPV